MEKIYIHLHHLYDHLNNAIIQFIKKIHLFNKLKKISLTLIWPFSVSQISKPPLEELDTPRPPFVTSMLKTGSFLFLLSL
jgi:hypothetical protein